MYIYIYSDFSEEQVTEPPLYNIPSDVQLQLSIHFHCPTLPIKDIITYSDLDFWSGLINLG